MTEQLVSSQSAWLQMYIYLSIYIYMYRCVEENCGNENCENIEKKSGKLYGAQWYGQIYSEQEVYG